MGSLADVLQGWPRHYRRPFEVGCATGRAARPLWRDQSRKYVIIARDGGRLKSIAARAVNFWLLTGGGGGRSVRALGAAASAWDLASPPCSWYGSLGPRLNSDREVIYIRHPLPYIFIRQPAEGGKPGESRWERLELPIPASPAPISQMSNF